MNRLDILGYCTFFRSQYDELNRDDLIPGRIAVENKNNYLVFTEEGELTAEVSGNLLFNSEYKASLPKVGDWVALSKFDSLGIIHKVFNRQTKLSRKSVDQKTEEQVIATNIDYAFVMQSANSNFNINRMERQVTAIYNSGAVPVVILSKIDLCEDAEQLKNEIKMRLPEVDIFLLSSYNKKGLEELRNFLNIGVTYTIIGSSGVGKSTLVNTLMGEEVLKTLEIREADSRGKHATTRRQMLILQNGSLVIDTPGMREFGLWEDSKGISETYSDFDGYAELCRYEDCSHTVEKGCAVIKAVEEGEIDEDQYNNYLKIRKELDYLERRIDEKKALEDKRKWKNISKESKRIMHNGRKRI